MKMEKKPYRSVKEAVELYGQRILAPELYANVLNEMERKEKEEEDNYIEKIKKVREELEIAKQNIERAKQRSVAMEQSLFSLQEELEETKQKLKIFKQKSDQYDIEFVGDSLKFDFKKTQSQRFEEEESEEVYEKRQMSVDAKINDENFKNNSPSMKNKKKKKSIFFIGGFFSKKK